MTFFQQQRGLGIPFLAIDGGAAFFGSPTKKAPSASRELQGLNVARNILNAYNYLGYHAIGIGPSDLQFGVDKLMGLLSKAKSPIVRAKLVEQGRTKPVFSPSVVTHLELSLQRI